MPDETTQDSRRINRRRFLKATGISAIGATGVGTLPNRGSAEGNGTVTITTVAAGNKPVIQKEVPADWWTYEEQAKLVSTQLKDRFADVAGVDGVGIGTLNQTISGRRISNVEVYVNPNGTDAKIPDRVNGVEVMIRDTVQGTLTCNEGNFDIMPGGVTIESSSGDQVTSTCEVERSGTFYMMTAAHLFTCNQSSITGDPAYQSGRYLGDVVDYDFNQDWAIVKRDSSSKVTDLDNEIEDYAGILAGYTTESGLHDLKSNNTTVYKQGITTCKESGQVERYNVSVSNSCNSISSNDYVETSATQDFGDSGGPVFDQFTYNGCYYISIISLATLAGCLSPPCSTALGAAAYHINNDHNISFDPEYVFGYCK